MNEMTELDNRQDSWVKAIGCFDPVIVPRGQELPGV